MESDGRVFCWRTRRLARNCGRGYRERSRQSRWDGWRLVAMDEDRARIAGRKEAPFMYHEGHTYIEHHAWSDSRRVLLSLRAVHPSSLEDGTARGIEGLTLIVDYQMLV